MKKSLLAFLLFISFQSSATHNRAGEIIYARIPPYTVGTSTVPVYTYSITLIRYTDDGTGIADRCADTIYFGDGQSGLVSRVNGGTSCGCTNAYCGELIVTDPNYMVKKNIYSTIHTYSSAGIYTISVLDPNRNQGVLNIPNSVNVPFYIESVIVINPSGAPNSSPVLSNPPIDQGRQGSCYYHNPGAYDPDGDSLSFQLIACKSGPNQTAPGFVSPDVAGGGTISINSSGLISWCSPQYIGEYNFAFVITEWRKTNCSGPYQFIGSVTRDIQALIKTVSPSSLSVSPLTDTCLVAGTVFTRTIHISSSSMSGLTLLGAAANTLVTNFASMNPNVGSGNYTSVLAWNTACLNAGNQTTEILFKVEESLGNHINLYQGFKFKILPPAPLITNMSVDTAQIKITWKKPGCVSTIKGYNIYRKIGLNTWTHSACENGVPAYSGFNQVGFNVPSDTSFTDTNFWGITNGSTGNYIVTAVTNDCTESFADTIKKVIYIVGLKENILEDNSVSVYPNPFQNEININLTGSIAGDVNISLSSVHGQLLFNQRLNASARIILPCPQMTPGIYFLRLTNKNGVMVKKIVKE